MANDFDESSANEEASKGLSWWYSADVLSRDKSDKTAKRIRRISITDRLLRHPGRLSMVYFGALIIIVTGLLLLPISTSDIIFTNFPIAFFTAVSALSTCGIPVVNTGEYWSMFGQVVVLFSIQFGGLGVMTFASMVALGVFPQTQGLPAYAHRERAGHHEAFRGQRRAHRGAGHRPSSPRC